jgi:hypothetical protein
MTHNDGRPTTERTAEKAGKRELPPHWAAIQSAIWLIGLAILAWQGWWFPGILVLIAVSGITQAWLQRLAVREAEQVQVQQASRGAQAKLPSTCPVCGAPVDPAKVTWVTPTTARCPYCSSNLTPPTGAA